MMEIGDDFRLLGTAVATSSLRVLIFVTPSGRFAPGRCAGHCMISLLTSQHEARTYRAQRNPSFSQPVLPSHHVLLLLTQTTEPICLVTNVSKRNLVARRPYHDNK